MFLFVIYLGLFSTIKRKEKGANTHKKKKREFKIKVVILCGDNIIKEPFFIYFLKSTKILFGPFCFRPLIHIFLILLVICLFGNVNVRNSLTNLTKEPDI